MSQRKLNQTSVIERAVPGDYIDFVVPEEGERAQEEQEFLTTLKREVDERLQGAGLRLVAATSNVTNQGYRFMLLDREKRRFFCGFTYDEAIELLEQEGTEQGGRKLIELVCERALEARAAEFAKNALAPNVSLDDVVKEHVPAMNEQATPAGSTLH